MNFVAHDAYADDGNMISQGADFAASRLQPGPRCHLHVRGLDPDPT
jgi:hypothetical protein